MRGLVRLCFFIACTAVVSPYVAPHPVGQAPGDKIADRTLSLRVDDAYLMHVLSTLSVDHRVPIGLEVAADQADEPKLNIDVKNVPLKQVLDLVTLQYPSYRWEVRDGVINFVPAHSRDPLLPQILGTHITRFVPRKGINKFDIRDAIVGLPEVKSFLDAHSMTAWQLRHPTYRSVYTNNEVDLTVSDTDLRGVLNKVVRDSEHKLWVIKRKGEKGEILQISL